MIEPKPGVVFVSLVLTTMGVVISFAVGSPTILLLALFMPVVVGALLSWREVSGFLGPADSQRVRSTDARPLAPVPTGPTPTWNSYPQDSATCTDPDPAPVEPWER